MKTMKKYLSVVLCLSIMLSVFAGLGTGFTASALTQNVPSVSNTYDESGYVYENYGTVSANDYSNVSATYTKLSVGGWYKYIAENMLVNKMAYKAATVTTDGWETVTQTFTTNDSSSQKPLMIQLRSLQSGAQWWAAYTNAYIDNIVISKTVTDEEGNETQETVTTNTYDESSITYSYAGSFSEDTCPNTGVTYTEMTVNGYTQQIGMNNVFVEQHTDSDGNVTDYGYAAHIGRTQNGNNNSWSGNFASLAIYDSNDENLDLFIPEASTTYTITFEYRLDKADTGNKAIYLDLLYANAAEQLTYNNTHVDEYTYTTTDAETEAETTVSEGNALHFGIAQNGTNYTNGYYSSDKIGAAFIYTGSGDFFTPAANMEYTLTLKYRADLAPDREIALRLARNNTADGILSIRAENILVEKIASITAATDGWQTVTVNFTTGSTVTPLMIVLGTTQYWWAEDVDVWVDDISITPVPEKEPEFIGLNYETLIDEDFEDVEVGALPEGWFRDYAYNFLWDCNKTTGLTSDAVGVKTDDTGDKYLAYYSTSGDHMLTLPDVGTDNYRFTVKMRYATGSTGGFGLVTDLKSDYTAATYANISMLRAASVDTGEISMVTRKNSSRPYGGGNEIIKHYDAYGVFSGGYPTAGEEVTLTCYHYDNVTYYYINNTYVGSLNDYEGADNSRIGLYNSYGADAQVLSVKVEEIITPASAKNYYYATNNIFSEDFSSVEDGAIPEGWDKEHKYVCLWAGNKVDTTNTVVKTDADGTKYLNIDATSGDYVLTLPSVGTESYRYSVKLRYGENSVGTFGIATDIKDDYTTATHLNAMRVTNKDSEAKIQVVTRNKNSNANDYTGNNPVGKDHAMADYFDTETGLPAVGDIVELTAYHFDNVTYFYIDGQFVDTIADYEDITATRVGLYCSYGSNMQVLSVTADEIAVRELSETLSIDGAAARYANSEGEAVALAGGLKLNASIDTSDSLYGNDNEMGIILASKKALNGYPLTAVSDGVLKLVADEFNEADGVAEFTESIINLSVAQMDTEYAVRGYVKADGKYYYSDTVEYTPSRIAELYYLEETTTQETKDMLDAYLAESTVFVGKNAETITFSMFSDLHYIDNMYTASVSDLNSILDRAAANNVDFVLQGGDFSNDIAGSPEITNAYLNNKYNLPAYGIYGNHELESANVMSYVTGTLTNDSNVVWGTADGTIGDGSIAYYYYDVKGFRFVCTDTNYSYDPTDKVWEHNLTGSFGPPSGNLYANSLGPEQLEWLEDVLTDAANKGLHCITVSHAPFNSNWSGCSSDAGAVQAIFDKVNDIADRTVIMSINGHIHTNRMQTVDNVFYWDVNCVRNGYWASGANFYADRPDLTYEYVQYDDEGNAITEPVQRSISSIPHPMGYSNLIYTDPLSAIVKISNNGVITVEGQETTWIGGLTPLSTYDGLETRISSANVLIK